MADGPCLLCGHFSLREAATDQPLPGITSDCRPWAQSQRLWVCGRCGHVQKLTDENWAREAEYIYRTYRMYGVSGGLEQRVFAGGQSSPRSLQLLSRVSDALALDAHGRLLDVGCGNGAMLRSFGSLHPGWQLHGFDINATFARDVCGIPGVEEFFSGDIVSLPGNYDFISLLHVLEHVPDPVNFLAAIASRLSPRGCILVEVPDFAASPFDLMVVDHCSHFSGETLVSLAASAGLDVLALRTDWVPKELTLLAVRSGVASAPAHPSLRSVRLVRRRLAWLSRVRAHALSTAERAMTFGVLGTALAGTWVADCVGPSVSFFADEDPGRVGKAHLDRPVILPASAPAGSTLYVAFPPAMAKRIAGRLAPTMGHATLQLPPAFAAGKE